MNFFNRVSRRVAGWVLVLLVVVSFSLMFWASRTDSPIDDELAHIPAGYGYVHELDYRLNPEHPPLVKALAMLPVLFLNPTFPTNTAAWQTEVNGEWDMGYQFLYNAGNNATEIVHTARLMPILLTILLIILTYYFARRLMGSWWALLPTFLIGLDPTILGQGHYVTTDIGAAFGILLALFWFTRYQENPSTKNLWLAGLTFGIAMVLKFSTPLLIPLYIFLVLVLWLRDNIRARATFKRWVTSFIAKYWKLLLIGLIGFVFIVYPIYFLFTLHYPIPKQVSDTTTILASFANGPTPAGQACSGLRCLADLDIKIANNTVLRPYGQYLLGLLMVLQRADGGNTIYFMGHVVNSGGPSYFPILYLLKEPIPTLMIVFLALMLALWWILKRAVRDPRRIGRHILDYLHLSFAEFSMASFVILYWGYSMHSPLNIGIRHILPTLPLITILAAGVLKKWILKFDFPKVLRSFREGGGIPSAAALAMIASRSVGRAAIKYIFLTALLVWLFFETIFAAPYFLSYFNEFGGGIWNGYHYVTDSNYDWGQDLWRLQSFVAAHPEIDTIAVDYFGGGNPQYTLGDKEVDWSSSKGNPANQGIHWLAVSVNTLQGAIEPLVAGETRNASDTYSWLTAIRPPEPGMGNVPPSDYRVGTSIFIYKL